MNIPKLAWYQLSRDELPSVAFGMPVPQHSSLDSEPSSSFNPDVAGSVGFSWEGTNSLEYHPPTVFVLQNQNLFETLSWLRVYARDAFPLSQFGRVVSMDDWKMIAEDDGMGRSFRDDRWASVVLGELLAQSEQDALLDSLPVSRAQACFSTAVARTHKLYDSYKATRTCTDRLRTIESDPRFLRRSVAVESLVPIWSMASTSFGKVSSASELAEFIVSAAESFEGRDKANIAGKKISLPRGLYSDSIEERVIEFQKIAAEATNYVGIQGNVAPHTAAVVAAGAFLVGRGTSHAFLIKKYSRLAPLAHIWFGLMAGIAGPEYWDPLWVKALKGVEKHIRTSFSWGDPPLSDMSWAEYNWVSNAVRGPQAFAGIYRQVQTSITIEVLPGASCQMRLHLDESKNQAKAAQLPTPQHHDQVQKLPAEVVAALEQIVRASDKVKEILSNNQQKSIDASKIISPDDLFRGDSAEKNKRVSKKPRLK